FFALMVTSFLLTTYLQTVMGYSALEAGIRMLPVAVGLVVGSRAAVGLGRWFGTKVIVAGGLTIVAAGLTVLSRADVDSGYGLVATALTIMGFGMALAMTPATEAIMGALPREKAGVGSAMNDVLREVGGTLGVAVLGSILASRYGSGMDNSAPGAAMDSVGAAHQVASQLGGAAGNHLTNAADHAFVQAMSTTTSVAAAVALLGALIALAFLPSRARTEVAVVNE